MTTTREMTFYVTYGPTSNAEITISITDGDSITFAQALSLASRELGVDTSASGRVNGSAADTSTPVRNGDRVEFNKPQGTKG